MGQIFSSNIIKVGGASTELLLAGGQSTLVNSVVYNIVSGWLKLSVTLFISKEPVIEKKPPTPLESYVVTTKYVDRTENLISGLGFLHMEKDWSLWLHVAAPPEGKHHSATCWTTSTIIE